MKNKILSFCLITCDVNSMYKYLFHSIKHIKNLSEYSVFNIIFQPPYTTEEINEITEEIKSYGFEVNYIYKKYENPSDKLLKMRLECASMSKTKFYVNLDDDMEFLENVDIQYMNLIYRLLEDDNIGVAILSNQMNSQNMMHFTDIVTTSYATKRGVITRRIEDSKYNILPEYFYQFIGSHDDTARACYQNLIGKSTIELHGGYCNHYENRTIEGAEEYGWDKYNEDELSVLNWWKKNCNKTKPTLYNSPVENFDKEHAEECYKKGCKKVIGWTMKKKNKLTYIKDRSVLIEIINDYIANL